MGLGGPRHPLDRMIQSHRRTGKLISRMTVAGGESEDGRVGGGESQTVGMYIWGCESPNRE